MSEVVENVSEQNSAPSNVEAAQPTEVVEKITNNVDEAAVVANAATAVAAVDTTEGAEESLPKPASEVSTTTKIDDKPSPKDETPSKLTVDEETFKPAPEEETTSPKVDSKKTPVKRTPSKRMSFIERAQKESEELVKNMGGNLEIDGGRRTRSSTRGTPTRAAAAATPPPAKKARTSPASGASTPTRARGRGRKIDTAVDGATEDETTPTPSKKKMPAKGKKTAAKDEHEHEDEELEDKQEEEEDVKEVEKTAKDDDAGKDDKDDSTAKDKESMDIPECNKESKESTEEKEEIITTNEEKVEKEDETKAEDKTDTVLEPVVEETQSQVAAESPEENITNEPENDTHTEKVAVKCDPAAKNESSSATKKVESVNAPKSSVAPMEEEKKEEGPKKSAEKPVLLEDAKEPTPEPMEVDSSSKSSDAVEKMDEDVTEVTENPIQVEGEKYSKPSITELNNSEKVEKNSVKENSVKSAAAVAPDVVITNSIDVKSAAGELDATDVAIANNEKNTEETTPAAKNENDLCEPKIATSPPISAANENSTVTTPQTCN